MNNGTGQKLYKKAKSLIPGGTQLLSKRPEKFLPELWPSYYKSAKGCVVTDLDDNQYYDMSLMGVGSCPLGYADDDVNEAVHEAVDKGSMCTLNAPEEVELAELLIDIHPWADMVRYARSGGESMAVAIRIARASTSKEKILFCGYHGWSDWYLASNLSDDSSLDGHLMPGLEPTGVPRSLKETAFPFEYNDVESFKKLVADHNGEIGGIVVEAIRNHNPSDEFVQALNTISKEKNIPLIVDEVSSGFRINLGGAHLVLGLKPDIAVFAKGMSNGYAMGAIIGKKSVMESAQVSFISSTYWTDKIGPTAAIATIKKMAENKVQEHLLSAGKRIQEGWASIASDNEIDISISGIYPLSHFSFNVDQPLVAKTLFTQLMLERGFIAHTGYYASYAHTDEIIGKYLKACNEAFEIVSAAIQSNSMEDLLKGPVCHGGFKRLT